jgi:hypothetical protein
MSREIQVSLLAWVAVWAFWLVTTRSFHPTFSLAIIVTTSLIVAYAIAVYLNHLLLIPKFWVVGRKGQYFVLLLICMMVLTLIALAIIREAYFQTLGPDPDPNGFYKHFVIDLFGMAVHLLLASLIVKYCQRFFLNPQNPVSTVSQSGD